ncbi:MAG: rhodanese-like domain-containing protein [Thermoanaerobaculia bacterium]
MRTWSAAIVATVFLAGAATAQMKLPAQPPRPATPSTPTQSPVVLSSEPSLESAKRIPRDQAIKMVHDKKAVFVDVRSRQDYDAAHIAGAMSIPEAELIGRLKEVPAKMFIITYCA